MGFTTLLIIINCAVAIMARPPADSAHSSANAEGEEYFAGAMSVQNFGAVFLTSTTPYKRLDISTLGADTTTLFSRADREVAIPGKNTCGRCQSTQTTKVYVNRTATSPTDGRITVVESHFRCIPATFPVRTIISFEYDVQTRGISVESVTCRSPPTTTPLRLQTARAPLPTIPLGIADALSPFLDDHDVNSTISG